MTATPNTQNDGAKKFLGDFARYVATPKPIDIPSELFAKRDGYGSWWECHSVAEMEGFTRIVGLTRGTVERLREGIMRKLARAERNGGIPVRHAIWKWEAEAYEFAAVERVALGFGSLGLDTHLSVAEVLDRAAMRKAEYAKYNQRPEAGR